MSDKVTLVFIPGSWHKPSCYDKIVAILHKTYNLRTVSITLPSTQGDPEATFKDDLDAARQAVSEEVGKGRNVIVVAHSYGGLIGSSVVKGFTLTQSAKEDNIQSQQGHVTGLVLIATGFALTGVAFMDPFFGHPPPTWQINKSTGFADIVKPPQEFFYHDLPKEEADYYTSQLTTHSLKSLFEGREHVYSGFQDLPTWYLGTIEDKGLPVFVQRMQVGMARAMGAQVVHRELRTSHSPFLSMPVETAEFIAEAVEAFEGIDLQIDSKKHVGLRGLDPTPRLFQPFTWFKFGIPLLMGRFFGRCILLLRWFGIMKS
jgi:pimeloyl-ACP methyl ester carboxylesterase